jgi:magnesium-transporting ATPase (P-type)
MEIIKLYQNILISYDFEIYDLINDKPAESRDTGLIEQLGQIDFLFSDKTGTLTLNQMQFKKCFISGKIYGAEKESNECTDAVYSINGDMSAYELLIGAIKNSNEKQEISSDPYIVKKEKIWV